MINPEHVALQVVVAGNNSQVQAALGNAEKMRDELSRRGVFIVMAPIFGVLSFG